MDKEAAIRHCIACCDGALMDDQRSELASRIGGVIEAEREACAMVCESDVSSIDGQSRSDHDSHWGPRYAAAIRARSKP